MITGGFALKTNSLTCQHRHLILFKYSFYKGKYYASTELALPLVNGDTCMPKQELVGLVLGHM